MSHKNNFINILTFNEHFLQGGDNFRKNEFESISQYLEILLQEILQD